MTEGGFRIARDLRKRHRIGIAYFTRKGTLEDAISAYEDHDAISVIKKPDPDPDPDSEVVDADQVAKAYDAAMRDHANLLAGQIARAIRRSSWWGRYRDHVVGFGLGIVASLLATAIWSVCQGCS